MLLRVLGRVDPHERRLRVEEYLGELLGEQRLAHAGGPNEQEACDGLVGVGKTRSRDPDRVRDGLDRLGLTHDLG